MSGSNFSNFLTDQMLNNGTPLGITFIYNDLSNNYNCTPFAANASSAFFLRP
jgi:hypothetical protein